MIDLKWQVLGKNRMITIIINGENKKIEHNSTLEEIITSLKIEDKVMAAAINMEIVKKENWSNFVPKQNDKLELLQFVGGG